VRRAAPPEEAAAESFRFDLDRGIAQHNHRMAALDYTAGDAEDRQNVSAAFPHRKQIVAAHVTLPLSWGDHRKHLYRAAGEFQLNSAPVIGAAANP
jgi:hypothetical protein